MDIKDIQKEAWQTADDNGFHSDPLKVGKITHMSEVMSDAMMIALIHSEASEALEALRRDDRKGFAEELADIVIRVCDLAEIRRIDLTDEIAVKMEKNREREYKHGGKLF